LINDSLLSGETMSRHFFLFTPIRFTNKYNLSSLNEHCFFSIIRDLYRNLCQIVKSSLAVYYIRTIGLFLL